MSFVLICAGREFLHVGVRNGFAVTEMFCEVFKSLMRGVSMKSDVDRYRDGIME